MDRLLDKRSELIRTLTGGHCAGTFHEQVNDPTTETKLILSDPYCKNHVLNGQI